MRTRPKSCGPSRCHAFRRIARRGIPFTAVSDCAFIVPVRSFGYHSSERAFMIDRFASQNLPRSEEHTSELQSLRHLVCRLLLEKKKKNLLLDFRRGRIAHIPLSDVSLVRL